MGELIGTGLIIFRTLFLSGHIAYPNQEGQSAIEVLTAAVGVDVARAVVTHTVAVID